MLPMKAYVSISFSLDCNRALRLPKYKCTINNLSAVIVQLVNLFLQSCSKLVESGKLKSTLLQFSHTTNAALQTVIAKIVLAVVDSYENK